MANCFVLRTKKSYGKIPKNYTLQVVTNNAQPTTAELKNALVKEGFPPGDASILNTMSSFDVLSKS